MSSIRSTYNRIMSEPKFANMFTEIPLSSLERRYNESDTSLFYFKSAVFYAGWGRDPEGLMREVLERTPSELRSGIHAGVANQFENSRCFGNRFSQEFHGVATGITHYGLEGWSGQALEGQLRAAAFGPCA